METQETKQGHTPGPWKQHTTPGKVYASVRGVDGRCVADCGSRSDVVAQANAMLIAAAPDILAALQECITAYEVHRDGQTTGALWPDPNHIVHARAAIAKATEKGE